MNSQLAVTLIINSMSQISTQTKYTVSNQASFRTNFFAGTQRYILTMPYESPELYTCTFTYGHTHTNYTYLYILKQIF